MKRREVLKGFTALGVMAFLPGILVEENYSNKQLHFVGLGQGGTNAMVLIYEKGIKAKYSCITGPYVSHLKPEMEHLFYSTHPDYRINGIHYKKPLDLTPEKKAIFNENHRYVILTGLGSSVGTGFIRSLLDFLYAENKNYLAICSLPSKDEGRSKLEYANQKKAEIEGFANVLFFDNQSIREEYGVIPTKKSFEIANELFYKLFMKCDNSEFNHNHCLV